MLILCIGELMSIELRPIKELNWREESQSTTKKMKRGQQIVNCRYRASNLDL